MSDPLALKRYLKVSGIIAAALIVLGIIGNLVAAPVFQPIAYELVYHSPLLVHFFYPALALSWIVGGVMLYLDGDYTRAKPIVVVILVLSVGVMGVMALPSDYARNLHYADRTEDKMTVETLGENNASFPAMDAENMRNVPLAKAKNDASNNYRASKHRVSNSWDQTYINGSPYWSSPQIPDSGGERWSGGQAGAVFVSQTNSDGKVYVANAEMKKGHGVQFWRSEKWNLQRHNYWYDYGGQERTFQTVGSLPESGGEANLTVKNVRILTKHEYHYKWGIVPYTVETLEGVAITHPNGSVEYLSVEEVRNHPELHDDNIYPYDLAKKETRALNWRQGFWNKMWNKDGLFKLAESDGSNNSLPYVVPAADGTKDYYIPVSPQGGGTGLKSIFIVDGQTGEFTQYKAGGTRMISASNVGEYVQGQTPEGVTNWEEYNPVEPLPVTHNGQLYWQVRILSANGPGMPGYAFVNASQPDDIVFAFGDNKDELSKDFVRGEDISDKNGVTKETQNVTTASGETITQIIIRKDGEVVGRFNATQNTTVTFEQVRVGNSTANQTATPAGG